MSRSESNIIESQREYISNLENSLIRIHDFVIHALHELSTFKQSTLSEKLDQHFKRVVEQQHERTNNQDVDQEPNLSELDFSFEEKQLIVIDYGESEHTDINDVNFWIKEIDSLLWSQTSESNVNKRFRNKRKSELFNIEPPFKRRKRKDQLKKTRREVKNLWLRRVEEVDDKLASLVGQTSISRADAYKKVWKYIKDNNLQKYEDKRKIYCDETLAAILQPKQNPIPNMWALNKLICAHFKGSTPKKTPPPPPTETIQQPSHATNGTTSSANNQSSTKPESKPELTPMPTNIAPQPIPQISPVNHQNK